MVKSFGGIFPSRSTGGIVQRGGFVHVHNREAILPAVVTNRWRGVDVSAPSGGSFNPTFAPVVQISIEGSNLSARELQRVAAAAASEALARSHAEFLDAVMARHYHATERDEERS